MLSHMRSQVLTLALAAFVATGCDAASTEPPAGLASTQCASAGAASPYAGTDDEQSVVVPRDGHELSIAVRVGDHFTVGWGGCNEHGRLTVEAGATGAVTSTDVAVYSSPRPNRTGEPRSERPEADGVLNIRYVAQVPGRVILRGEGSAGSNGTISITVQG